jgi:hypothetical protein
LIRLDFDEKTIRVSGYRIQDLDEAQKDYLEAERSKGANDAVLVSVESMKALKRAYPNYFLDIHEFIDAVREGIH